MLLMQVPSRFRAMITPVLQEYLSSCQLLFILRYAFARQNSIFAQEEARYAELFAGGAEDKYLASYATSDYIYCMHMAHLVAVLRLLDIIATLFIRAICSPPMAVAIHAPYWRVGRRPIRVTDMNKKPLRGTMACRPPVISRCTCEWAGTPDDKMRRFHYFLAPCCRMRLCHFCRTKSNDFRMPLAVADGSRQSAADCPRAASMMGRH